MESQWHIIPEFTSLRYMAQLLSQGLRLKDLKKLLRKAETAGETSKLLPLAPATHRLRRDPCIFWAAGKCTKGVNCTFFHDPEVEPENQETLQQERKAAMASMNLSLAHCSAMLGAKGEPRDGEGSHSLFQQLGFEEGRREVQRILQFASAAPAAPDLLPYLCRTFLFSLTQSASDEEESVPSVSQRCVNELLQRSASPL